MNDAMMSKIAEHKDFVQVIRDLGNIFEKADRKALARAFADADFKGVCAAMHVSEDRLKTLLKQGSVQAGQLAKSNPEVAVEALRQHTANGSRS
jgi:hypothetical protein